MRYLVISIVLMTVSFGSVMAQQSIPDSRPDPRQDSQPGAQTQEQQRSQQDGSALHASDKQFAMKAAEANITEVELGEMAVNQASDSEIKQFGREMVNDHNKARTELNDWAAKRGVTLPTEPSAKQRQMRDRLSQLSGPEFDREFMRIMVRDHEQVVALFEKEARSGHDQDLKNWANRMLPTLREHLSTARNLANKVGASAGTSSKVEKSKGEKNKR
jgi:putative membrane protein